MAAWPKQSVASELLANDRTLVVPAPPLSLTTSGDLVWIALSDGKVEVRNARTGEVVRRFEPAAVITKGDDSGSVAAPTTTAVTATATATTAASSSAAGILFSLANRVLPCSSAVQGSGDNSTPSSSVPKKRVVGVPAPVEVVQVRTLLAVPIADGNVHIWLGLSSGGIEIHEGGDLLHSTVGAVSGSMRNSLRAVLRKHTSAVTCLAEFGGFVYSGSEDCRIVQWRALHSTFVHFFSSQSPHQGAVRCLYAEGNAVVSGSDDCTVKVWDVGEGTTRLTGYFHSRSGGVLSLCRVGELMWSGDATGQVVRWHIRTCEAVAIHRPHCDRILSLCHVGDRVYSGSADGTMGIFDAHNGQLLQQITDQALGWVTNVMCPAELSRFVVWSASTDGAVRCWYQDEYVSMFADECRFNDPSWYESGSTPYREFRAAVGQRTERLKRHLEVTQQRDQQAMLLLRRCSTVFGGGAGCEGQQRRLQEQLTKAEERCGAAEARQAQKRKVITQLDRDIAVTLALLHTTKSELNLLLPGEAERLLATMPAPNPDDQTPYGQGSPSTAATSAAPPPSSTSATETTAPPGPPPALALLPLPSTTASVAATAPGLAVLPPPQAATPSTLGVGGPLSTAAPSPLPATIPAPDASPAPVNTPGADAPATITTNPPPPPPPATTTAQDATPTTAPPQPSPVTTAAITAAHPVEHSLSWTNPHVGNYIQRRYYGASPSLRTTDLMKQERQRGRLPRVKVVPLQRSRSQSATANMVKSRTSSSAAEMENATTTTSNKTAAIKSAST